MNIVEMSVRMSNEQGAIARKLCSASIEVPCFRYEGVLFYGNRFHAAMEFAYNNPGGGDYYVWLQQNYKIVNE